MNYMFRLLEADEIEVRVGTVRPNGITALLYKDARCDQAILDETIGPMNWQRSHCRDNANCIVSIWDKDKEQWISKEDTGTESKTEKEKGLASDSFKRACVNWGIGRELYTAPKIWISKNDLAYRTVNGKEVIDGELVVTDIQYDSKRRIVKLCIVQRCFGTENVVYDYPQQSAAKKNESNPAGNSAFSEDMPTADFCKDCGNVVTDYISKDTGKVTKAVDIINKAKTVYGRCLCGRCFLKAVRSP